MNYYSPLIFLFFSYTIGFSQKGTLDVHFIYGTVKSTHTIYLENNPEYGSPYLQIGTDSSNRFPINVISFIEGIDQDGINKYFKPIDFGARKVWAERTYHSPDVELFYLNKINNTNREGYENKYFKYSMVGEDEVKEMTYANLKNDFGDYAPSMEHLKEANKLRLKQSIVKGIGGALMIYGIAQMTKVNSTNDPNQEEGMFHPALPIGAAILVFPLVSNSRKKSYYLDAIKAY